MRRARSRSDSPTRLATRFCSHPTDACAGSRATCISTSRAPSARRSSLKDPTRCSSSRCARYWPTHSSASAASLPRVQRPSVLSPTSRGLADCGRWSGVRPRSACAGSGGRWRAHTTGGRPGTTAAGGVWQALVAEHRAPALHALYGPHAFVWGVARLGGDGPAALAHGRRAAALAEEHGSVFSRVEAAAFLGAAELADGDLTA